MADAVPRSWGRCPNLCPILGGTRPGPRPPPPPPPFRALLSGATRADPAAQEGQEVPGELGGIAAEGGARPARGRQRGDEPRREHAHPPGIRARPVLDAGPPPEMARPDERDAGGDVPQ